MTKHFTRKSALLLSLITASAISYQVSADTTANEASPEATGNLSQSVQADMPTLAPASTASSQTTASTTTNAPAESVQMPAENKPVSEMGTAASPQTNTDGQATTDTPVEEKSSPATPSANTATPAQATPAHQDTDDLKPIENETVDMRILATTDLHTNLVNYDYYQDKPSQTIGLAKTAVLIDKAKTENPNALLVDNGDTIQGTPLGTYEAVVNPVKAGEKHPMYAALEALGFEATTLGNHEFNYGLDYLKKVLASTSLATVNANVLDAKTGKFVFDPYKIITKTFTDTTGRDVNLNIGITGIVPPQILNWDKANLEGKVTVRDSVQAIQDIVPVIRKAGADVVLVLSHSGIGDDKYEVGEENVGYQIAGIDGVDAVVTGHSHAEFPSGNGTGFYEKYKDVDGVNGKITGTPVVMAGKYGDHLGIIDLKLTYQNGRWQVASSHAEIRKIDTKSDTADNRVLDIAKNAHEATIQYVREQVGTTTAPINSYFALVQDDPSIQIVNNAQRWYVKQELAGAPEANLPILSAAAPFKAGARDDATAYTDIPAGPIAIKNVADLYLYDNVTAVLKITGKDLREWLEMSAGQFNQIDPNKKEAQQLINTRYRTYNFDVIDGVSYQFDVTQPNKYDINGKLVNPTASRVRNLTYMGQPVTDEQEFMVATNNYRANGTFPGVRNATINRLLNLENRQVIINYIIAQKTINPSADMNWSFTDSIKGLDVHFRTAEKAKTLLDAKSNLSFVASDSVEGFGDYKYTYVEHSRADKAEQDKKSAQGLSAKDRKAIFDLVKANYRELNQTTKANVQPAPAKSMVQTLAIETTSNTSQTRTANKVLPKTNDQKTSLLSLLGLTLTSLAVALGFKSKRN